MENAVPRPDTINALRFGADSALAMLAGMQLEVFTPLQHGPMSAEQIADAIGVAPDRAAAPFRPKRHCGVSRALLMAGFPCFPLGDDGKEAIARVQRYVQEVDRDPATLGMEGRITLAGQGPDAWIAQMKAWEEAGATHVSVGTSGVGFTSPQEHIDAIRRFKEIIG